MSFIFSPDSEPFVILQIRVKEQIVKSHCQDGCLNGTNLHGKKKFTRLKLSLTALIRFISDSKSLNNNEILRILFVVFSI